MSWREWPSLSDVPVQSGDRLWTCPLRQGQQGYLAAVHWCQRGCLQKTARPLLSAWLMSLSTQQRVPPTPSRRRMSLREWPSLTVKCLSLFTEGGNKIDGNHLFSVQSLFL